MVRYPNRFDDVAAFGRDASGFSASIETHPASGEAAIVLPEPIRCDSACAVQRTAIDRILFR